MGIETAQNIEKKQDAGQQKPVETISGLIKPGENAEAVLARLTKLTDESTKLAQAEDAAAKTQLAKLINAGKNAGLQVS